MPDQWERHARSKDGSGDRESVPSRGQARDAAIADQGAVVRESPNAPRPSDPLVRAVADAIYRTEVNYDREGSGPGSRFEGRLLEDAQAELAVRVVRDAVRAYCEGKAAEFSRDVFPVRPEDMRVSAGDILGIIGGGK